MRTRTIFGRQCKVEALSIEAATEFLQANHRSGATGVKATTSIGLFHGEELLGLVQFGHPRTAAKKREYTQELYRMAFKADVRVTGGASKLIGYYIDKHAPSDFFTYQATTGESTDVYLKAGMTLVSKSGLKKYLVAPGKTLETAARREYWSIGEVARRGPDALLKTSLGEKFHADGTRKTNVELFIEELDWHEEVTSGDRIYEWINPDRTYYTYKITAPGSDKYYRKL